MKTYYVYLLASARNGTLYCGVTNDLVRRVSEHRQHLAPGFTARHGVHMLVWYEAHTRIEDAIAHETRIKGWRRIWKLALIERDNPQWRDLWIDISQPRAIDRTTLTPGLPPLGSG